MQLGLRKLCKTQLLLFLFFCRRAPVHRWFFTSPRATIKHFQHNTARILFLARASFGRAFVGKFRMIWTDRHCLSKFQTQASGDRKPQAFRMLGR